MSLTQVAKRVVRSRNHVGKPRRLTMTPGQQWRVMNFYPPFLGMGLRIHDWTDDWTHVEVKLLLTPLNRNTHGTAFGGALGAMTDAFHALLLIGQLGPDYLVWDVHAEIDYVAPGAGTVYAVYDVPPSVAAEVRAAADAGEKVRRWFDLDLTLKDGTVVARVRRQVYISRRRPTSAVSAA